jgi:hypothetical protein
MTVACALWRFDGLAVGLDLPDLEVPAFLPLAFGELAGTLIPAAEPG